MSTKKSQQTRGRSFNLRIHVLKKILFKKEQAIQYKLIQDNFLAMMRIFANGIDPIVDEIPDQVEEVTKEEPKHGQRGMKRKLERLESQPKRFKE